MDRTRVKAGGLEVRLDGGGKGFRGSLATSTPGFKASVYAANTVPGRIGGWTKVSATTTARQDQKIPLDTASRRFRYYLVWITELPEDGKADIRELSLEKEK